MQAALPVGRGLHRVAVGGEQLASASAQVGIVLDEQQPSGCHGHIVTRHSVSGLRAGLLLRNRQRSRSKLVP